MKTTALILFLSILMLPLAAGAEGDKPKIEQGPPLKGGPKVLPGEEELLRKIFPEVTTEGTAHKSVAIRDLHEQYDPTELTGEMTVNCSGKTLRIKNGSRQDAILCVDVAHQNRQDADENSPWGGETLLALFRLVPSIKLLDVVDIRQDRESGLWSESPILRGASSDALLTYQSHLNAGEEFFAVDLVEIAHDKFVLSRASLPTAHSVRAANSAIAELPTLRIDKSVKPPRVSLRLKVTCKLFNDDSDEQIKKSESMFYDTKLLCSGGRWSSIVDKKRASAVEAMRTRFGFTDP